MGVYDLVGVSSNHWIRGIIMALYMITDLRWDHTETVCLDAMQYQLAWDSIQQANRSEYRYEIEPIETNKALKA